MPQPPGSFHLVKDGDEDRRIVQGADNFWTLSFDSSYGVDWTGFACRAQFRRGYKDDEFDVLAAATCSIIDSGPAQRIVQFVLSSSETDALTEDSGLWDAEIYNGTLVFRIVSGRWSLWKQVTE